ncbi:hypothetical protein DTL21_10425 [Bremerella cremea]|uniref:Proteinase inhibitor I42 chagasin domain-containing protein n=1 Tax=Blastopirellula marina TaxID=124 RepID=A0A2S8FVV9_9BACT|nr:MULTISPECIES: hypothetical protein [Pirellulaceae]PQO36315.1 hypothetical protein C5Y83_10420 [Blastopirellula marina]RCS48992.1 hypothetical protein DTL21_10425 [Bremerella cremea]
MKTWSRLLIVAFALSTICLSLKPAEAEDNVVGIIWEIGRKQKNGKVKWEARFRATPDKKLWSMGKADAPEVVGEWSGDEEKTNAKVPPHSDPRMQRFIGEYEFVLVKKVPKVWEGTFKHQSGVKIPIVIRLIED